MMRTSVRERSSSTVSDREAAKRCLVAIIEDDTEFRNMLRELLEEEQYRVVAKRSRRCAATRCRT